MEDKLMESLEDGSISHERMGSTSLVSVVRDSKLFVAQLGDSNAVMLSQIENEEGYQT